MVEIIKRGKLPGDEVKEATCPHCKTKIRFKRSEARYSTDQRDGDAMVIECPVCNTGIWFR